MFGLSAHHPTGLAAVLGILVEPWYQDKIMSQHSEPGVVQQDNAYLHVASIQIEVQRAHAFCLSWTTSSSPDEHTSICVESCKIRFQHLPQTLQRERQTLKTF